MNLPDPIINSVLKTVTFIIINKSNDIRQRSTTLNIPILNALLGNKAHFLQRNGFHING